MSLTTAFVLSVLLLCGNAFFVAAEFALVASRQHRLERAAARGSRTARAALAGVRELSLMLAGAQLGITVCSLGLGMVTEPALAGVLHAALHHLGVPLVVSHSIAFVTALAVVVFAHMVVGEMAPKSWAIAHPEAAATALAVPFRAFTHASRPLLRALNSVTNTLLRLVGVQPRDALPNHAGPAELRVLVNESRRMGLLEPDEHELLIRGLDIQTTPVRRVMTPRERITAVPADATPAQARQVARASRHTRLVVHAGTLDHPLGTVHVRDVLIAHATGEGRRVADLAQPAVTVAPDTPIHAVLAALRRHRTPIALVAENRRVLGLVSLDDLLRELCRPGERRSTRGR